MNSYKALNMIGSGAKILGKIGIALAVVGALLIAAGPFIANTAADADVVGAAIVLAFSTLASGVGSGIVLIAFGELAHLMIDLAHNSARTAELLERALALPAPAKAPAKAKAEPVLQAV